MSLSVQVASELPVLRTYAHITMGSRAAGDAVVCATLEAIVQQPNSFSIEGGIRNWLFAGCSTAIAVLVNSFPGLWDDAGVQLDGPGMALSKLSLPERQVLVLSELVGFDLSETAEVLSISAPDATRLLIAARAKLDSTSKAACEEASTQAYQWRQPAFAATSQGT